MFKPRFLAATMGFWILAVLPTSIIGAQPDSIERFGHEGSVKVRIPKSSFEPGLLGAGARIIADYDNFIVVEAAGDAVPRLPGAEVRPEENFVLLNAGPIDTTQAVARQLEHARGPFAGKRLHLVQFAGPIRPEWYAELEHSGAQIVTYLPSNAYLIYGDAEQLARVQTAAESAPYVQWNAEYLDAYKIQPKALPQNVLQTIPPGMSRLYAVQLVEDPAANADTLVVLDRLKSAPVVKQYAALGYRNFIVSLLPEKVMDLARQPDVVSIQVYETPKLLCERQDQIVAGNLSGDSPSGPGYLQWLVTKGFTQAQFDASNFVVDVSDSGVDDGTTTPNHFGLYVTGSPGGTSRVKYNRLVGFPNPGSTLQGCDGHGNLNAHVIAGYDNIAGFPFQDTSGFHYGLGVCPFARVGSSVIFDPSDFTFPDYSSIQSQAYNSGARISSNSWGSDDGGAYSTDSQSYDALVRDAQPTGSTIPLPDNQEMVIVFANGNAGAGPQTVGSPATGKNVISVGAAENVQAMGGSDFCGASDSLANNANEMAPFSSRGPCADGRNKPDIVAPGTHVSGGVAQASNPGPNGTAISCFNGNGVCGGVGSNFFPSGQEFYTTSTGTSHSCPCVAGGCALIRQFFINQAMPPPSPAMTKALLINSARYMLGVDTGGNLWSNSQGMGEMNLGEAFKRGAVTPTIFQEQDAVNMLFTASGQARVFHGTVADGAKPFRVTLVWTDAPGSTTGSAFKNDLDLTVFIGGSIYLGNNFSGDTSTTIAAADTKNNAESVFLAAGVSGAFTVAVTASNINSDGVPNVGTSTDQDFALVIYNALPCPALSIVEPSLPDGAVGAPYNQTLTGSGGAGPYTFAVQSGSLPSGLTLSSGGVISGMPTESGNFDFTARTTDAGGCTATHDYAINIVCTHPGVVTITQQPVNQSACPDGPVTFEVSAESPTPLTFQWRKDGNPIGGATQRTFSIAAVGAGDLGAYDVVIKNECDEATTTAASLAIVHPQVMGNPDALDSRTCDSITFSVNVEGLPPFTYQWRHDGQPLADDDRVHGSQTIELAIDPLAPADSGAYDVVVTSSCGQITSDSAQLTVRGTSNLSDCPQSHGTSTLGIDNVACAQCGTGASLALIASISGWGVWRRRRRVRRRNPD